MQFRGLSAILGPPAGGRTTTMIRRCTDATYGVDAKLRRFSCAASLGVGCASLCAVTGNPVHPFYCQTEPVHFHTRTRPPGLAVTDTIPGVPNLRLSVKRI